MGHERSSAAERPDSVNDDPITEHFMRVGKTFSALQGWGAVERCNCMVRYGTGEPICAIRKGKGHNAKFFTPEGEEIETPTSFEDMKPSQIIAIMKERGEVYIGHILS